MDAGRWGGVGSNAKSGRSAGETRRRTGEIRGSRRTGEIGGSRRTGRSRARKKGRAGKLFILQHPPKSKVSLPDIEAER
jgi:hypothetical protein